MTDAAIAGTVAPGFESVQHAFARNFREHGEIGAAFAVHHRGRVVVDLWGGVADTRTGRPWSEDTVAIVFSTTKGVTALVAHRLVEQGVLDLDAPVVTYWPEFGAAGKEHIPLRWLLSHRAGLPALDVPVTPALLGDWDAVCRQLASQTPVWEPGTAFGYHALSFGHLVGEVVRRASGRTVGQHVADLAGSLGLSLWLGLPEEIDPRLAHLETAALTPEVLAMIQLFAGPDTLLGKALGIRVVDPGELDEFNEYPELRRAEIPAANAVTDARSLSRLYAAMIGAVDGVRVLSAEQLDVATTVESDGPDRVLLNIPLRFGSGFMLSGSSVPLGGPSGFGHYGAGGSVAFADADAEVAMAYVMNGMQLGLTGDARTSELIRAVYESLGAAGG